MLQTRFVCETLLPDVLAPEAHQNDRSYVLSSVDLLSIDYARILHDGRLYGEHKKKRQNWGVGVCMGQYGSMQ